MTSHPAPPATGDLHIGRLRIATDRPMAALRAQALGEAFGLELGAALGRAGRPVRVEIDDLVIDASGRQLDDPQALGQLARSLAQRILDRTPE